MSTAYVSLPCRFLDTGGKGTLCICETSDGRALLTADQQLVLRACARLTTREQLDRRLASAGWQVEEDPEYVDEILAFLLDSGLLRTEAHIRSELAQASGSAPAAWHTTPPSEPRDDRSSDAGSDAETSPALGLADRSTPISINWLTGGRPEVLARSVRSFLEAGVRAESGFTVFHDRAETAVVAHSRRLVEEIAGRYGVRAEIRGIEDRRAFVADLADSVAGRVDRRVLEAALLPFESLYPGVFSAAALRNWILLATVGEIAVSSDDDVYLPALRRVGFATGPPAFSSEHDPQRARFCLDWDEIAEQTEHVAFDMDVHRRALERLVDGGPVTADLSRMSPALAGAAARLRPALTCAGMAGDSGMTRPYFRLLLTGEDRDEFLSDATRFGDLLSTRLVIRHAPGLVYTSGLQFMTPHVAFDNRLDLVPFPPVGRSADEVFRCVLGLVAPEFLSVHLPFAVQHRPADQRTIKRSEYLEIDPRINDLLLAVLVTLAGEATPARGHRAVGLRLAAIASTSEDRFRHDVTAMWIEQLARYRRQGLALLRRYRGEPKSWAEALSAHLDAVEEHILSSHVFPRGFRASDAAEAWRTFQDLVAMYGEMIAEWPTIRAAAVQIAFR